MAGAGQFAGDTDRALLAVLVEHGRVLAHREARCAEALSGVELCSGGAGLGRAEAVHDRDVRRSGFELLAHSSRQGSATVAECEQGGKVVGSRWRRGDRLCQRAGHCVADRVDAVDALAADETQHLVGVEAALGVEHDRCSDEHRVAEHPLRAAVHHRPDRHHRHRPGTGCHGCANLVAEIFRPREWTAAAGGVHRREERVFVAPHHTLWHAGGTAGVEDVQVVTRPGAHRPLRRCGCQRGVVGGTDLEHVANVGEVSEYGLQAIAELRLHDHADTVGVVVQVAQLVVHVAVVDVDRHCADLEAGEERLDPFGAVHRVDRDVITRPDTDRRKVIGESVRSLVELGVGPALIAGDQRGAVRRGIGHFLEQIGEVVGATQCPPLSA